MANSLKQLNFQITWTIYPLFQDDSPLTPTERPGSRSSWFVINSTDSSLDADDEFECECEHCQVLRQHRQASSHIDFSQPLTLDLLERSSSSEVNSTMETTGNDLDYQVPTSSDSSFDSATLRQACYITLMFVFNKTYCLM